jgi:pimeloyl-ACP methyl ester carboxylesterase
MTDAYSPRTGEVVLDDVPFFYEITGQGHPLVLAHAGIADHSMWDEQVVTFAQHYQVIRYDLRGYGKTPMIAGTYSHQNDLYNLLQFLDIKSAYLLGCSLGGMTIIDFALEHPTMVDALIPVSCVPEGYEPTADDMPDLGSVLKMQQEHVAAIQRGNLQHSSELEANYWLTGPRRSTEQIDPTILTRMHAMNIIALTNKVAALGKEQPLEPPAIARLSTIHIPTLTIIGDLDDPFVLKGNNRLATELPDAKQVVIAGTAHFPNMERPDEFNHLVLDFLASR